MLVLIKDEQNEKKLTYGPNDARRVIWARFPRNRPPGCLLRSLQILYTIKHLLVFKKTRKYQKKKYSPMAQTTRLTSLGPVFRVAGLPVVDFVDYMYHTL